MSLPRFYSKQLYEGSIELDKVEAHHLSHVLRIGVQKSIELFDGKGRLAEGVVERVGRDGVSVRILRMQEATARQKGRVIIATSPAKCQRFDWLVSKCTEIGVDHIACVLFDRTVKLAAGDRAVERYDKVAISAAKQSGRLFLPVIDAPRRLDESMEALVKRYPDAKVVFGGFTDGAVRAGEWESGGGDVIAVVGPEGGLTEGEEQVLRDSGATEVHLVDNVLRVETAAVVFAAVLCSRRWRSEA